MKTKREFIEENQDAITEQVHRMIDGFREQLNNGFVDYIYDIDDQLSPGVLLAAMDELKARIERYGWDIEIELKETNVRNASFRKLHIFIN